MKQETLEDFLYQYWFDSPTFDDKDKETFIDGGLIGAKWQQEQDKNKYSEEDMRKAFNVGRLYLGREGDTNFEQLIEQFKNK